MAGRARHVQGESILSLRHKLYRPSHVGAKRLASQVQPNLRLLRLQSKPLDGQQVEPALAKPGSVRGEKPVKAIGRQRANSASGPASQTVMQLLDRIYLSSRTHGPGNGLPANEEESIYSHSEALTIWVGFNGMNIQFRMMQKVSQQTVVNWHESTVDCKNCAASW